MNVDGVVLTTYLDVDRVLVKVLNMVDLHMFLRSLVVVQCERDPV